MQFEPIVFSSGLWVLCGSSLRWIDADLAAVSTTGSVPGPLQPVVAEAADAFGHLAVAVRTAADEITIGVGDLDGRTWGTTRLGVDGQPTELLGLYWMGGCFEGVRASGGRTDRRLDAFRKCAGADLELRTLPAQLCPGEYAEPLAAVHLGDAHGWSIVYLEYSASGEEHLMTIDEAGQQNVIASSQIAEWSGIDLTAFGLTNLPATRVTGKLDGDFNLSTARQLLASLPGPPDGIVRWYRVEEGGSYHRRYVWRVGDWTVQRVGGCELSVRIDAGSGELRARGTGSCLATERVIAAEMERCDDLAAPFVAGRDGGGYWLIDRGGCVVEVGPNLEPISRRSHLAAVLTAPSASWGLTLSVSWLILSAPFLQLMGLVVGRRRRCGSRSAVRGAAWASGAYLIGGVISLWLVAFV